MKNLNKVVAMKNLKPHRKYADHLAAGRSARSRMNNYSDAQRSDLDTDARSAVEGGKRRGQKVCSS